MNRYFTLPFICIFFSSCFSTQVNYLGSSLQPTKKVDVYVDVAAVKRPYTIIGKGYADPVVYYRSSIERMQESAIEKAREKGADAVLFQEVFLLNDGTTLSSAARDSIGRLTGSLTATVGPVVSSRKEILFLKYN